MQGNARAAVYFLNAIKSYEFLDMCFVGGVSAVHPSAMQLHHRTYPMLAICMHLCAKGAQAHHPFHCGLFCGLSCIPLILAGKRLLAVLTEKTGGPHPIQEVRIISLRGDPALGNAAFSEACCVELPQYEGVGEGVSVSWMGQKIIQWQQVLATPWEFWGEAGTPHAGALIA